MPITNSFTCPKGHTFDAVAKIRARCPECGTMARKPFGNETPTANSVQTGGTTEPKPEPKSPGITRGPIVLRQGRPNTMPARKSTTNSKPKVTKPTRAVVSTSKKVSGGIVKVKRAAATTPTVKRLPKKTSVSKVASSLSGQSKSFLDQVIDKYGI